MQLFAIILRPFFCVITDLILKILDYKYYYNRIVNYHQICELY